MSDPRAIVGTVRIERQEGEEMDEMQRLAAVRKINAVFTREHEDEDGDKYLSQADYAMEAIDAALEFERPDDSPIFRQFMESSY